jgi:hypothetical protein
VPQWRSTQQLLEEAGGFPQAQALYLDSSDDDPIAAEDWLREMEKKLDLTTCSNEECVGVTTH